METSALPEPRLLTDLTAILQVLQVELHQARREVRIRSQHLSPSLHRQALYDALLEFARHEGRQVRLLLDGPLSQTDHYLLLAAQRLPSRIELRRSPIERAYPAQEYWLFDRRAAVIGTADWPQQAKYQPQAAEVAVVWTEFQEVWDRAQADPEHRQMRI